MATICNFSSGVSKKKVNSAKRLENIRPTLIHYTQNCDDGGRGGAYQQITNPFNTMAICIIVGQAYSTFGGVELRVVEGSETKDGTTYTTNGEFIKMYGPGANPEAVNQVKMGVPGNAVVMSMLRLDPGEKVAIYWGVNHQISTRWCDNQYVVMWPVYED